MSGERQKIDVGSSNSGIEVKARMSDTYARPAVANESAIENIAQALVSLNPNIQKYLAKQKEKKENFDVAVGAQLYKRFLEEGKDLSANQIQELVAKGDVEGFRRLSTMQKQGIIQARYNHLGNTLSQHMLEWYGTATAEDENGNAVPLSSLKDQSKSMLAFEQEAIRYGRELTGDSSDPLLYAEYVEKPLNTARQQFIQTNANRVREEHEAELVKGASSLMDDAVQTTIKAGAFITDTNNAVKNTADSITAQIDFMQSKGLTKAAAYNAASQWMQKYFANPKVSVDDKDALIKVAESIPDLMDDPAEAEKLHQAHNSGIQAQNALDHYRRQAERDAEELDIEEWFNNVAHQGFGSVSKEMLTQMKVKYPSRAGYINNLFNDYLNLEQTEYDASTALSPEDYATIRTMYRQGKGSMSHLRSLASRLDRQQWNELTGEYGDTLRYAKQAGSIAKGAAMKASEAHALDRVAVNTAPPVLQKALKDSSSEGADRLRTTVAREIYLETQAWKKANPNADIQMLELQQRKIGREVWKIYGPDAQFYIKNPDKIGSDPKQVRRENVKNKLTAYEKGVDDKHKGTFKELIKSLPDDGNVTPEQVKTFTKMLKRSQRQNAEAILKAIARDIASTKQK